jgi:hypothetical protein
MYYYSGKGLLNERNRMKGAGRGKSFLIKEKGDREKTFWMKVRVAREKGKGKEHEKKGRQKKEENWKEE